MVAEDRNPLPLMSTAWVVATDTVRHCWTKREVSWQFAQIWRAALCQREGRKAACRVAAPPRLAC